MCAADGQEVKKLIKSSISNYKSKNVRHYAESYIMNMVVELEDLKQIDGLSAKALRNVNAAIEILNDLSRQGYGYVL
jgi:hypothetical protein